MAKVCRICSKKESNYICPKCNISYCSLSCYKSHSKSCTENFALENYKQNLNSSKPSKNSANKIREILKRLNEETSSDLFPSDELEDGNKSILEDKNETEIFEKLKNLAVDGKLTLEDLPPIEQRKFQNAVESGLLNSLVEEWHPWWERAEIEGQRRLFPRKPLISLEESSFADNRKIPPLPKSENIFAIKNPKKSLIYDLINIIMAYCFVMKLYNGEATDEGFFEGLLRISAVFSSESFSEISTAVGSALRITSASDYRCGRFLGLSTMRDASIILYRPGFILRLLEDCRGILKRFRRKMRNEGKRNKGNVSLFKAEKKIEFFISWTKSIWDERRFEKVAGELAILWKADVERMETEKRFEKRGNGEKEILTK